ncbi:uridine-cytidine kinase, putative [Entamoeba invadens IP1]|uniref:uridine/cytidine kinase n=2 Tax=Entamoeba invadens TaxID=33085 RepID=A0A0A1UF34_ENTIV|nr:uridine-cytidine kinase, putative [Entamoeba invadens IP1]ELP91406.1 uridine-cytidine kinase, putative [Entamoeba invadens IP1]BAN41885.1 uridine-cytidine kinase, putative [Entamoeba invadens]|eukprot:XP_004258177.1 uridine-cytidine kinase, putative [Entamoeba invadens IP1]
MSKASLENEQTVKYHFYNTPCILIAVAGGTASGKTTFCTQVSKTLEGEKFVVVSQDSFYRPLTKEEHDNVAEYNFDSPDAFDWQLIVDTLKNIKAKKPVSLPIYDYVTHSRKPEWVPVEVGDVVMFEGLYTFFQMKGFEEYVKLFDLKIFIESDDDTRLGRRILRDMKFRGRTLDSILFQYKKFVKPAYEEWVYPQRIRADVIVPWCEIDQKKKTNFCEMPALKMVSQYIRMFFTHIPFQKVLSKGNIEISADLDCYKASLSDQEK